MVTLASFVHRSLRSLNWKQKSVACTFLFSVYDQRTLVCDSSYFGFFMSCVMSKLFHKNVKSRLNLSRGQMLIKVEWEFTKPFGSQRLKVLSFPMHMLFLACFTR